MRDYMDKINRTEPASETPIDALERIRLNSQPRFWSALFQQKPTPDEGDYFKAEWLKPYQTPPSKETLRIYGASDFAVTSDGGDYTCHVVVGVDPDRQVRNRSWQEATDSSKRAIVEAKRKQRERDW
jgi:hypothetical protein